MQGRSGPIILSSLRASICEVVRDGLRNRRRASPDEIEVQFIVGAYLSLVTWWLDRGAKEPVAAIDGRFRKLAMGALTD
jgi:hypothetical protein